MASTPSAEPVDRSGLVELGFGRVYVRDHGPSGSSGSGPPPLLLLHGFVVTHHEFRHLLPELARTRRVLALDLPGCGESDRPAPDAADGYSLTWMARQVAEVLVRLGVGPVDVLGHSLGGAIAVCLAEAEPTAVRRLILLDTICFTMPLPPEGRLALVPRLGPYLFRTLYRRAELRRYLTRAFSTPELVDEEALDLYWDRLARRGGLEAAHAILQQLQNLDHMRERFRNVRCSTMAVWGDHDALIPLEMAERMVQLLPDAHLQVIEGCGHAANEERPNALLSLVHEFLDD